MIRRFRICRYMSDVRKWGVLNTETGTWVITGTHAACVAFCFSGPLRARFIGKVQP